MKKFLLSVLTVLLVISMAGCSKDNNNNNGSKEFESNELYVFNWGEYIDEENIKKFEAKYGVRVYYKTFDSNEEMYTAVVGGDKYDIIVPSDYMVERMIKEKMIQPLDLSLITNIGALAEGVKSPDYDPKHEYSVPYFQGSVGIAYDKNKVSLEELEEKGWSILADPKYAGEVYMYDADRDNFLPALKALGYSVNTTSTKEIEDAYQWLLKQKQDVKPDWVNDIINDYMIGTDGVSDKALAVVYSGAATYIISENENVGYYEPKQGTNVWGDAMCIPTTCTNVKLAHAWINFMLEEEVAEANSLWVGYTSSVQAVIDKLSGEGGDFYGIESYTPRVGYPKDEEYHDDVTLDDGTKLKTKLAELGVKVK
ncbi:MAG: ABC transporter substrate-binding protein [Erysipelotrichaceae bacterium]|nr:ABC transporter substrate-binding protein [Erysipelotrichaceae bacterium]